MKIVKKVVINIELDCKDKETVISTDDDVLLLNTVQELVNKAFDLGRYYGRCH